MSFNLIEEQWIPILRTNGAPDRVGIRNALINAGDIRLTAASNPMDNITLLRFMLAVLMWCKPSMSDEDRKVLNGGTGIPEEWITNLGTPAKPAEAFNLLGDQERFFQDRQLLEVLLKERQRQWDARERKKATKGKSQRPTSLIDEDYRPIGDLLVEFPTETKSVHFRHVRDKEYGFCPACCALGIIRFCGWANAYGGGRYTSAINGPTPAYAVPYGTTLLQSLAMNWPSGTTEATKPPWLTNNAPSKDNLNSLHAFAWRSRQIWLGDQQPTMEPCSYCGDVARLIYQHVFTGNWKPPFATVGTQKKFWDKDSHLILEAKSTNSDNEDDSGSLDEDGINPDSSSIDSSASQKRKSTKPTQQTTLGFPSPGSSATAHNRFWRRAWRAILAGDDNRAGHTTMVVGPAANKGLYQDATVLNLPAVPTNASQEVRETINSLFSTTEQLMSVLRRSTLNPDRQHPNRKACLDARSPDLEAYFRMQVEQWLAIMATPDADASLNSYSEQLASKLYCIINDVVRSTTVGSPLRRREAMQRAAKALSETLRKYGSHSNKLPPSGGSTPKHQGPNAKESHK
ncbi:MAG: type I-E CRISPR-associated protein Cse1/CasA [Planctomycetota bacterium]|nr:type I-E CRISPR-associated protein Cse1/CasA [Planctomycetota bacterium]